jgi:hypothetical protein
MSRPLTTTEPLSADSNPAGRPVSGAVIVTKR